MILNRVFRKKVSVVVIMFHSQPNYVGRTRPLRFIIQVFRKDAIIGKALEGQNSVVENVNGLNKGDVGVGMIVGHEMVHTVLFTSIRKPGW